MLKLIFYIIWVANIILVVLKTKNQNFFQLYRSCCHLLCLLETHTI